MMKVKPEGFSCYVRKSEAELQLKSKSLGSPYSPVLAVVRHAPPY